MPKNALFHAVDMKNGHREWWEVVPAQSAEHARSLFETSDIAVTKITCLKWRAVDISWNGSEIVFCTNIDGENYCFESGMVGYDYLKNYFHVDVIKILQSVGDY